jgi:hypothetical protein
VFGCDGLGRFKSIGRVELVGLDRQTVLIMPWVQDVSLGRIGILTETVSFMHTTNRPKGKGKGGNDLDTCSFCLESVLDR